MENNTRMDDNKPTLQDTLIITEPQEDTSVALVGQPTKYKPEYCTAIIEYFTEFERYEDVVTKRFFNKDGEETGNETTRRPLPPPTFYGFARKCGVCRDTVHQWSLKIPEFKLAYAEAKAIQGQFIIENAMCNISPQNFSKFMMENNFGWTSHVKQEVTNKVTLESLIGESMEGEKK